VRDHQQPVRALSGVVRGIEVLLHVAQELDLSAELQRLEQEIARLERLLQGTRAKLSNENFLRNAPAEVVERERQKEHNFQQSLDALRQRLSALRQLTDREPDHA
jgi:valyl-tRNA synthetase